MTHRSRQLSDDAKPPPREAVFRFGDKVERNLEQEREATMTKAPSPTTSLTPEEKLQTAFSRSGATQCGTPKECFDVFPIRKQRGQRRCGEICCDQQSERCRRKGCSGLSKPTRKLFLQPSCGCWPGGATSWEVEASIEHAAQEASPNSLDADGPRVEAAGSVAHHDVEPPPNQSQTPPSRDFAKVFAPSRRKPPR
jgi:hypothetical protein